MTLGEVIQAQRKAQGLNQTELGELVGALKAADENGAPAEVDPEERAQKRAKDQATISRIENGWKGFSVQDLEYIASALKISVPDLYHFTYIPTTDPRWRAWLRSYGVLTENEITLILGLAEKRREEGTG